MSKTKFDNYLRTYRKNRGLSQPEVAFLLGCHNAAKVSRYERSKREPSLETLFAYEVILGVPLHNLYAGIQQRAERSAQHRIRLLERRFERRMGDPALARKLAALEGVARARPDEIKYQPLPQP